MRELVYTGFMSLDGVVDSPGGGDVIVLDENRIVQADPVIGDAAGSCGGFFKTPKAGRGFTRIEDFDFGPRDSVDVLAGEGGYPA